MGVDYYARAVVGFKVEVPIKRVEREIPVFDRRTGEPDGTCLEYLWEQVWNKKTYTIPDYGYSDELENDMAMFYKLPVHPYNCENFTLGVVGLSIPEDTPTSMEDIQKLFEAVKCVLSAEDAANVKLHVFPYVSY